MTHHFDSQRLTPAREMMICEVKQQYKAKVEKELSFQQRVDLIATWLESDIAAERRDMNFELRVEWAHRLHWRDCQPQSVKAEVIQYYAAKQAARPALFKLKDIVKIRNGRDGVVIRVLTDGRLVVYVDCPLSYWEYYRQDELAALNVATAKAAA